MGLKIYALFTPSSIHSSSIEDDSTNHVHVYVAICGFSFEWVPSISPGQWCFAAAIKSLISSKLIAFPSVMNKPAQPICSPALARHSHNHKTRLDHSHIFFFCSSGTSTPVLNFSHAVARL